MNTYATIQLYLRMLQTTPLTASSPIKTPSFIPKWTLQYVGLKRPPSLPDSTASMFIVNIVPVGHHSNGQDGCEYVSYTRRAPGVGDCEPVEDLAPDDLRINTYDGNFSVDTFHSGGLYHRWITFGPGGYTAAVARETTVGGAIEYRRIDGLLPEVLAARYGKLRWSAGISQTWNDSGPFSRVELRYRFEYAVGTNRPAVHVAEALLSARRMPHLGYYYRYYRGRDYLNIAFDNHIHRFEVGFAFNWENFWRPEVLEPPTR